MGFDPQPDPTILHLLRSFALQALDITAYKKGLGGSPLEGLDPNLMSLTAQVRGGNIPCSAMQKFSVRNGIMLLWG